VGWSSTRFPVSLHSPALCHGIPLSAWSQFGFPVPDTLGKITLNAHGNHTQSFVNYMYYMNLRSYVLR